MTVEHPRPEGEGFPTAKKRRVDSAASNDKPRENSDEPFYPFKLVPSPQEARTLETGKVLQFVN